MLTNVFGLAGTILTSLIGAVASVVIAGRGAKLAPQMAAQPATAAAPPWLGLPPQHGHVPGQQPAYPPQPVSPPAWTPRAAQPVAGGLSPTFILGLVGLLAWCLPIIGVPLALVSLGIGISNLSGGRNKRLTKTGMYLSLLSLVAGVANAAIGAHMGATGQF